MNPFRSKSIALLFMGLIPLVGGSVSFDAASYTIDTSLLCDSELKQASVSDLEQRLAQIDSEIETLARFKLRNEVGAIGHRSKVYESAEAKEWIQVEFGKNVAIDEIVLVPTLWHDTNDGYRADGFPVEFQVIVGTPANESGNVIASFSADDRLLPRVAPVVVACESVTANWLRIEATKLSRRGFDGKFIFQLSEILVFEGQENVALHKPVHTSSQGWVAGGARDKRFLVDGDLPYTMNCGGRQSLPFIGVGTPNKPIVLTIDLLRSMPINRIQFHGIDLDDTVPRSTAADFGVSRRLVIEGANRKDFNDRVELLELRVQSEWDVSPIVARSFEETDCRYIRLIDVEPYVLTRDGIETTRLGFAEIEVFSAGYNVALEKPVAVTNASLTPIRPAMALTDGHNQNGKIIPIRKWLAELSRRHDLEAARPIVLAALNKGYVGQKQILRLTQLLVGLLVTALATTFVISNRIRKRKIAALRKRFAADLHDELGANLYTIGLLSDLAQRSPPSSDEFRHLHTRIRFMTMRSATAIRYWAGVEKTDEFCTDLISDMRRSAERIVVHLEHEFNAKGHEYLDRINSQTRGDILLFYKECLINICRHSEATQLGTELVVNEKELRLIVMDNGRGLPTPGNNGIPASLQRRALLLGADIQIESPSDGGTGIRLSLRIRKRRYAKGLLL